MFRKILALPILVMALFFGGQIASASAACTAVASQTPRYDSTTVPGTPFAKIPWVSARMYCDEWVDNHRYQLWSYPELSIGGGAFSRDIYLDGQWSWNVPDFPQWDTPTSTTKLSRIDDTYSTQFSANCTDQLGSSPFTWRLLLPGSSPGCQPLGLGTAYLGVACNSIPNYGGTIKIRTHTQVVDLSLGGTSDATSIALTLPSTCHQ